MRLKTMSPFVQRTALAQVLLGACTPATPVRSRAMARNLLSEHRLSNERFAVFANFAGTLVAVDRIARAIEDYQATEVRPVKGGPLPAYQRPENGNNAVEIPARSHVVTILDLTGLGRVYAEARPSFKLPQFRDYAVTNPADSMQINDFLASRLGDPNQQEAFLKAIIRALSLYRRHVDQQVRPTWVAEWRSLQPFLSPGDPARWLRAVGVPRDQPVWLAVFRYPVKTRKREIKLFRPTQIDAGWYAHHFPSPPEAVPSKGGHAMDLREGPEGDKTLVSEYLHAQSDLTIADWRAAGRLVGYTGAPVSGDLSEQRKAHWNLLQTSYGDGVLSWMPDYV